MLILGTGMCICTAALESGTEESLASSSEQASVGRSLSLQTTSKKESEKEMQKNPHILINPEKVDASALAGFDLLEIESKHRQFSRPEINAIIAFVETGKSLMVVIDEEKRTPLLENGTNSILERFGLRFTDDTNYLHNCGALAKKGKINSEDREIPYSGGRAVEGGTAFAWRLDASGNCAEPFASYVETPQGGRVIALSEAMAYIGMGTAHGERLTGIDRDPKRTTYWGKDTKVFMEELRSWLIQGTNQE